MAGAIMRGCCSIGHDKTISGVHTHRTVGWGEGGMDEILHVTHFWPEINMWKLI